MGSRLHQAVARLLFCAVFVPAGCVLEDAGLRTVGVCGDGRIDAGESCDGAELAGQSCESLGLGTGVVSCASDCRLDTSACQRVETPCGNGVIDDGEDCDGEDVAGLDCSSLGQGTGSVSCTAGCTLDTSACSAVLCNNGELDPGEPCDGSDLAGQDCESLGLSPGTLSCTDACTFELSGCPGCGNGVREADELCDGSDLGGLDCDGILVCDAACSLDASGCTLPSAGDGSDGLLTVATPSNLHSLAAPAYAVASVGADRVVVSGGPATLAAGDEVILINMQGSNADCAAAGAHEFLEVASVSADEVVFQTAVTQIYGAGGSNADLTGQRVVIQRIPHFSRVHITSTGLLSGDPWDGATGGLMVMRVSEELLVETGGALRADGLGFRGGVRLDGTGHSSGRQGESLCGNPQNYSTAANYGGGGGGKFEDHGDGCGQGGGGGAFGEAGSWAGWPSDCLGEGCNDPAHNGGQTYGAADLPRWLLGSGAGSGATDDNSDTSGQGGRGGGLVVIFAARIAAHGSLTARGTQGGVGSDSTDSGNGGGGSGGAIYLRAGVLAVSGAISAEGSIGAPSQNGWNSPGGDGGAGRIRVDYHEAGGHPFGTDEAESYLDSATTPASGHSELCLD